MTAVEIRTIEERDPVTMAQAFAAIGWSKPVSLFERYLREHVSGTRVVLLALVDGRFAGYVTVSWFPDYPPVRAEALPEIQDLNVLPQFRRKRLASSLLDRAEAMVSRRSEFVTLAVGLHPGYNGAQRLYGLRGYVPDGRGVTCRNAFVQENQGVALDDDLLLHLVKRLEGSTAANGSVGVVLNGSSSAGKTSVARAVRSLLGPRWVVLSIDDLFPSLHPDRPCDWATFYALTQVLFESAAAFARLGFNFVVDTVFERAVCYDVCRKALSTIPTLLVCIACPLPLLVQREQARPERRRGLAADQASRIHSGYNYDLSLNTADLSPEQCAVKIAETLRDRNLLGDGGDDSRRECCLLGGADRDDSQRDG